MTAVNAAPTSARVLWTTVALAFSAVLLDGFDSAALAFSVPVLAGEWGLSRAAFTAPLVLTNLGVVVGYLACGPLSARLGRRRVLIGGVVFFAVSTLLTAVTLPVQSVPLLSVTRVLTGLGLGAVLPAAVALATDHAPVRRRQLVSVAVTLGLASGATLGGLFGGRMLQELGAAGVFWIAGGLPLALAAVMAWRLPAAAGAGADTADTARRAERVSELFPPGMRMNTALIWAFSFLAFLSAYTLQSWVPSLMGDFGFADSEAPLGLAFFSIGGIAGGVLLVWLASRVPIALALCALSLTGAACAFAIARADLGGTVLLVVLGGTGLGLVGSQIGQLAMAVALYPAATRTTGVGWAAALGRIGSIVGPAVAGVLLGLSLPGRDIVLLTTLPVLTAALCALLLWRRQAGGGAVPAAQRRT
ncbi:aromatic acid/H+ symport family MFS transporter [Actinomadura kijaniata]|uniref:AAHS family 4-hydroxybenzoate transporter-like MFS transporter n=1 Tax=Actinomadura namibiensis TaxID=182080 RepID=A0A7W3LT71_ACTNM|nr:MFS transporter [Actinomadura namibiensis]MBA8953869.1 AAHS family 4-hydroxybenzoate transporter-like MFS transporter [Actinomadura namibiensis]